MSSRLIEVFLPNTQKSQVETLLSQHPDLEVWYGSLLQQQLAVRIFARDTEVEPIIDQLAEQFQDLAGFRLLLLEVEAALPQPQAPESLPDQLTADDPADFDPTTARLNREEIYDRVAASADLSWVQIAMVMISTIIAAIGILRDNQAVVIGAMVIAPLLKPNMALGIATTLGDTALALRTLRTGLIGIALALGLSAAIGALVPIPMDAQEITSRLRVDWLDGILAFASGVAGAIALTTEARSSLVGVMVSVALLPPLVVLGLLLGAGAWATAWGTALLVATNLICLNLAAVTTFLLQDLRPRQWQAADQAQHFTQAAYGIWLGLLLGLVGVIAISRMVPLNPLAAVP